VYLRDRVYGHTLYPLSVEEIRFLLDRPPKWLTNDQKLMEELRRQCPEPPTRDTPEDLMRELDNIASSEGG
jgi:hypothetical protein